VYEISDHCLVILTQKRIEIHFGFSYAPKLGKKHLKRDSEAKEIHLYIIYKTSACFWSDCWTIFDANLYNSQKRSAVTSVHKIISVLFHIFSDW